MARSGNINQISRLVLRDFFTPSTENEGTDVGITEMHPHEYDQVPLIIKPRPSLKAKCIKQHSLNRVAKETTDWLRVAT